MPLFPCPACGCHVSMAPTCPLCGATLSQSTAGRSLSVAAGLLGLVAVACVGEKDTTTNVQPLYGTAVTTDGDADTDADADSDADTDTTPTTTTSTSTTTTSTTTTSTTTTSTTTTTTGGSGGDSGGSGGTTIEPLYGVTSSYYYY